MFSISHSLEELKHNLKVNEGHEVNCVATLSGGIDSTCVVNRMVQVDGRIIDGSMNPEDYRSPLCVYMKYGSKSTPAELRAATATCKRLDIPLYVVSLDYTSLTESPILTGNQNSLVEYDAGSQFWLEGRNSIIALAMASIASYFELNEVYLGINASDGEGSYLDTSMPYLYALNTLVSISYKNPPRIRAPLLERGLTKAGVISECLMMGVDFVTETHSCSSGENAPCCDYFVCESCYDRRYHFEEMGRLDPFMPDSLRDIPMTGIRRPEVDE